MHDFQTFSSLLRYLYLYINIIIVVQLLSHFGLFAIPWVVACQALLSSTIFLGLLKLMFIELVMSSNSLIHCRPLLLLPSIFPSIKVFSSELALHSRWPKKWSFSISIRLYSEYSGLISFRIDWFNPSLLQHHNLKAPIPQPSVFFMVPLSQPYMTTRKTIPLAVWLFVSKVISLLFNTLSRFVIAFLPRSKHLLISMSIVILEPKKNKMYHCFYFFPIYLPWSDGTRYHNLCFLNVEF